MGDETRAVRVAAVGDLHVRSRTRGLLRPEFASLPRRADLLLLAGDLTDRGRLSEAHTLADEIGDLGLPMVAVLGNHDHETGEESQIRALLSSFGIRVLDGTGVVVEVRGIRVGVAGTMGFDGGFGNDFDLWYAARVDKRSDPKLAEAARLGRALTALRDDQHADVRIALTHYSPVLGTLEGEPRRIIPCCGNQLLGRTVDEAGADLAVHGHAHFGSERGRTVAGIAVRNVARRVLGRPYAIYEVAVAPAATTAATTAATATSAQVPAPTEAEAQPQAHAPAPRATTDAAGSAAAQAPPSGPGAQSTAARRP